MQCRSLHYKFGQLVIDVPCKKLYHCRQILKVRICGILNVSENVSTLPDGL